jgi:KRAB domain-containing zinc finger protein
MLYDYLSQVRFPCEECGQLFSNETTRERHKLTHERKLFKCHECGKRFARKDYMKWHVTNVHIEAGNIPCMLCGKMYKNKKSLQRHHSDMHSKQPALKGPYADVVM